MLQHIACHAVVGHHIFESCLSSIYKRMSDHTELGRDTKGQSMTRGPQFFQSIITNSATLS